MPDDGNRLSVDDARILALESAVLTGHTLKLMILSPGTPLDLQSLRESVSARLRDEPRALERVDAGHDGAAPCWIPAEHFDIAGHVRRRDGTGCATHEDLRHTVGALMSEHLDRSRPLWTFDLIGPLADGSEAIAARIHHAMVDGIAGMRFLEAVLLDPHDAPQHPVGTHVADTQPSMLDEWRRLAFRVKRGARSIEAPSLQAEHRGVVLE